jgi:uncharacterized protein (TIGR02271 family)
MEQQPNTQGLVALSDAKHLDVARGNEDIRGWEIRAQDGTKVGKVKDLIVDPNAMKTRYIDAELDRDVAKGGRRVLIPVGAARLADDDDIVLVNLTRDVIAAGPAYEGRGFTQDYERSLRSTFAGAFGATGTERMVDDERFYDERGLRGSRRGLNDDEVRVTRSEEELAIGKRRVEAGEAYLRKTVDTERVSEPVTRMREEVTIERHAVNRDRGGDVEIGEDEIRVPITEEEIVVEKRPVVKEEIVVKKRAVEETENVEAEVRRERVDVDDTAVRSKGKSAGAKFVDKLDDVKDRVDGNPRSRPGPDATDRR